MTAMNKGSRMKHRLIAITLAASAFALGGWSTFPPENYDYGEAGSLQDVAYGTIESVRLVDFDMNHPATANWPREQTGEELVVRLDSGQTIAVVQGGSRGFQPGQRVRVLSDARRARVEYL
jgi:outer membrane lipoprotein SlyB